METILTVLAMTEEGAKHREKAIAKKNIMSMIEAALSNLSSGR
jgi:hypothetical protein